MTSRAKLLLAGDRKIRHPGLPLLSGLTKYLFGMQENPHEQLVALHRAEIRAKVKIRAALNRFADEVGVLRGEVDDVMLSVDDSLDDLAREIELGFVEEIEDAEY